MSEETFDIMQFAEETAADSGGGRPMTCQVRIDGGYISYAPGLSPSERFFNAADLGKDEAKAKAEKAGEATGAGISPVVRMTVFKDSVLGRDTSNWKYDILAYDYIVWQSAYKEVFLPALKEAIDTQNFNSNVKNWVTLAYVEDPYKPKRADGSPNWRAYILDRYPTKEAAAEAMGLEVEPSDGRQIPAEPDSWHKVDPGEGSWVRFFNGLVDNFKKNPDAGMSQLVLLDGGVTLEIVQTAKRIADDERIPF